MRHFVMRRCVAVSLAVCGLMLASLPTRADPVDDCRAWPQRAASVAITACSQVLKKDPAAQWAYVARGYVYQGQAVSPNEGAATTALAVADFTKAIELDRNDVMAYSGRASAYEFQNKYDAAIPDRTREVELTDDKGFACSQLEFAYAMRSIRAEASEAKSLADADPTTAAVCASEAAKPKPEVTRAKVVWPTHLMWWGLRFAVLFAIGGLAGLLVASIRAGDKHALRYGLVAGAATLGADAVLNFDDLLNLSLPWWVRFRSDAVTAPLEHIVQRLGFANPGETRFWSGPWAGYSATDIIAPLILAGPLIFGVSSLRYLDVAGGLSPTAYRQRALVIAFPLMLVVGLGIAVAGFTYGPRDYMGQPGWQVYLALIAGIALAFSVPLCVWRRSASTATFAIAAIFLLAVGVMSLELRGRGEPPLISFALFFAAYQCFQEWRRVRSVQRAGLLRTARFAFAWPLTTRKVIEDLAETLDVETLAAAYHLSDHTDRSKDIIRAELAKRGRSEFADDGWLPTPARAMLPPAVRRNIEPARYQRWMRNRHIMQSTIRWTAIVGLVTVVGLLVAITLVPLMTLVGGIAGRKRTARVLLLRPFGQAQMTRALKRVVRKHLGLLGHTYTLSDQNYRPNYVLAALNRIFDWVLCIVGPFLRPSFRVTSVKDERTFFILDSFLLRTVTPSFLGLLCSDQAFNIRTTDTWWKRCIDVLMWSSDVIVMDITSVSTGSAWEINELSRRRLLGKCVFIAQEGHTADMRHYLPGDEPPRVFVFDADGRIKEPAEFDAVLTTAVLGAVARWGDAATPLSSMAPAMASLPRA
jgi:hypothetical protein